MIHDLLYSDKIPEIHAIVKETDNEIQESELGQVEQSPNPRKVTTESKNVASLTVAAVASGSNSPSDFVSAVEAANLQASDADLDMRPYIFDGNSKQHCL